MYQEKNIKIILNKKHQKEANKYFINRFQEKVTRFESHQRSITFQSKNVPTWNALCIGPSSESLLILRNNI